MLRTILLPLFTLLVLAGCETMGGMGQDIETTGEAITQESNEVQSEM